MNKDLKLFLSIFVIVLTIGVSLGLVFLFHTTSFSPTTVTEGLIENDEVVIDGNYELANGEKVTVKN